MENEKVPIGERLDAIGEKLELLTVNVHAMQEEQQRFQEEQRQVRKEQARLEAQERRSRRAIAEGIVAYFKALNEEPDQSYYDNQA